MKLFIAGVELAQKIKDDKISMYATCSSFFIIVSFFPFIMLLFCLLQYTPVKESYVLTLINDFFPSKIQPLMISMTSEIYGSSSSTLLSVTAVSAIWSAGKGFVSIIKGLNDIYDTGGETRNYFILRFHSVFYTLALVLIIIVSLIMLVFGQRIMDIIEANWPFLAAVIVFTLKFRILIMTAIMIIFFLIVYRFIPNRKSKFSAELPGAVITSIGWIGFSYIFSVYVNISQGFSSTYGSLATLVFIMLWLYACMNIMFFGAEVNSIIAKHSQD